MMFSMFDDLPPCRCASCGAVCRRVPITHRDGRTEIEGCYCTADGCEMRGRNQRHLGRPGIEVAFFGDGSHRFTANGKPSQGEQNAGAVSRTFVEVLKRDGLECDEVKAPAADPGEKNEVDADCRLWNGYVLRMQVTRALPQQIKAKWAKQRAIEYRGPTTSPVEMLRAAIAKKTDEYRSRNVELSKLTLLIDGIEAPQLVFFTTIEFECAHGDWARSLGWESIWVVEFSCAKRLDMQPELPRAWTTPAAR